MAILSGISVLSCQSIQQTLAFYEQLLQFVVVNKREEEGELQWVHLMHGCTTLMLQGEGDHAAPADDGSRSTISLYFFVDNIHELHHLVKLKHPQVSDIIQSEYRIDEFSMKDPEGHRVIIGQKK